MEEKIAFWREVMSYAADCAISFYVVTWNIFVNGTNGAYGITDTPDEEASQCWDRFAEAALRNYTNPLWMNRVGYCDWQRLKKCVRADVKGSPGD